VTLLLVRHADAEPRGRWEGSELLRPLTRQGRAQASGLVHLLGDGHVIGRLASSPSLRCLETLLPLASVLELDLEVVPALQEGEDPGAAVELARDGAMAGAAAVVLCTHGDLVPAVLEVLEKEDGINLGSAPRWQKGSTWVLQGHDGRFSSATYLPPPATARPSS
jgi:8-oxo-dGTP diphosphatase